MYSIVLMANGLYAHGAALCAKEAPDAWGEAEVTAELGLAHAKSFVVLKSGEVCGYANFHVFGESAHLNLICVRAANRRAGAAAALLQSACAVLAQGGATTLTLDVRAGNTAAVAFYNKMGFTTLARRENMYKNPAEAGLTMQLALA